MLIARLSLLLLLFLVPLVGGMAGEAPLAVFGALIALGWFGWATAKPRPALAPFPLTRALGVLVVVTLLSTLTSVYWPASLLGLAQLLIVAAGVLLAFALPQDRRHLVYGVVAFSAGMALGELHGLYYWYTWLLSTHQTNWRVQSTWEDPNYYAEFLLVCLPVLAWLARRSAGWTPPPAGARAARPSPLVAQLQPVVAWAQYRLPAIAAGLGLLCLVMTQSRGALLALLAVALCFVVAWLWVEGKLTARAIGILALGVALFIGLALASPVGNRVLNPVTRAKQLHSQKFRSYTWKAAWHMTKAHPLLGTGPNTFLSAFGQYQLAGYTRQAHNLYLQQSSETGLLGLLALLGLFGAIGLLGVNVLRAPPVTSAEEQRLRAGAAVALLAGLLGLLLHGLVDAVWSYTGVQFALLLPAALVWHLTADQHPARPAATWMPIALPVGAALLTLLMLPGAYARQVADDAEWGTQDPLERANLYRQALALAPLNASYLRAAAALTPQEEARGYLERACALEPTNAVNWEAQGHYYYRGQEWNHARAAYAKAVAHQPHYFPALFGQAQAAWKAGDLPGARAALREILATIGTEVDRYHPVDVPEPWYTLAWYADGMLALRQQQPGQAITDFQHTLVAVQAYQDGSQSDEAKAMLSEQEKAKVRAIASLAHEQLAKLLQPRDPAAAQTHRAAIDHTQEIPVELRETPFP